MSGAAIALALNGQSIDSLGINTALDIGAGARIFLPDGTAAAPSLTFTTATTAGLSYSGGIGVATAGVNRMKINATTEVVGVLRFNTNSFAEFFNISADPGAPSQGARLYAILDAAKAELRARFPTGASPYAQVAQEP